MNHGELNKVSKSMSYVLRHRPDTIGIKLEDGGWVCIDTLLLAMAKSGKNITRQTLDLVVVNNDKQRFEVSADGVRIRARQGHSVEIDLGYEPATPPGGVVSRHGG